MYTLADIKTHVAPFVTAGGTRPGDPSTLYRINQALRRLSSGSDWRGTTKLIRVRTYNNTFALPRECLASRLVSIDASPRLIFSQGYVFLESGPTEGVAEGAQGKDIMDLGDGHPTFFDMPSELPVVLMAGAADVTAGITARVFGYKADGTEIPAGEAIPLSPWGFAGEPEIDMQRITSTGPLAQISSVQFSAKRTDYVTAFAFNRSTNQWYFLAKYHPDDLVPGFQRYRILGADLVSENSVVMQVKLRHIDLSRDTDIPVIQNMDALALMCKAIWKEGSDEFDVASELEARAMRLLMQDQSNATKGQQVRINIHNHLAVAGKPNLV